MFGLYELVINVECMETKFCDTKSDFFNNNTLIQQYEVLKNSLTS